MSSERTEHMEHMEHIEPQFVSAAQQRLAATLGMWVFLATEMVFFGPMFFGYWFGRSHFGTEFAMASRHTDFMLGTLNTGLLLTSSVLMANAVAASELRLHRLARWLLFGTAALGIAFLAIKGWEYHKEWEEGLFPGIGSALDGGEQLFFMLYFAMTALHALHLAIGICTVLTLSASADARRLRVAGLYWHFVDAVWIFLYPLLYLVGRAG